MLVYEMADGMSGGSIPSGTPSTSSAPSAPSAPVGTTAKSSGQATSTPTSTPSGFYSYKWEDGKEHAFSSKEELDSFFRGGVLRHDAFTKKTQELAEKRKAFEAEQKRLQESYDRLNGLEGKWKPIDEFFAKNPQLAQRIMQEYKGKTAQQVQADPGLKKELDDLRKMIEEKDKKVEQEERRKKIYDWMGSRYQDFDGSQVDKALSDMLETPEGDEMRSLVELVYWANKGRMSPAQIEGKITENLAKKQSLKPPMTSSGSVPNGPKGFKTLEEAAEAARAKYS